MALPLGLVWLIRTMTSALKLMILTSSDGNVALTGARYRGHTETGKRFEVIATAAIERSDNPGDIDLSEPIATIFSDDGIP